jgi:hypothetical protein
MGSLIRWTGTTLFSLSVLLAAASQPSPQTARITVATNTALIDPRPYGVLVSDEVKCNHEDTTDEALQVRLRQTNQAS